MTGAISQYGSTLQIAGYTVAQVEDIGEIKISHKMSDASAHDSGGWGEVIPSGSKSAATIAIKGRCKPGDTNGQVALRAALVAGTLSAIVITDSTGVISASFNGYVEDWAWGGLSQTGDAIEFSCTLHPSGVITQGITASNNVTALTITTATLYPIFAAGTYAYTATSTGASVTVTATFAAGTATVTNGTSTVALTSTVASAALALGVAGTVTTITIVVTETGKVAKTYIINIAKTA